jgi:hypothetical protein
VAQASVGVLTGCDSPAPALIAADCHVVTALPTKT